MYFILDFDSRTVESKSEDVRLLEAYIEEYDLGQAVVILNDRSDVNRELTVREMKEALEVLGVDTSNLKDHLLPDILIDTLVTTHTNFPKFTKSLGKKLVKRASKEASREASKATEAIKPVKAKRATDKRKPTSKSGSKLQDDTYLIQGEAPKVGTQLHTIYITFQGGSTLGDILFEFDGVVEERLLKRYITKMIRKGHLIKGES